MSVWVFQKVIFISKFYSFSSLLETKFTSQVAAIALCVSGEYLNVLPLFYVILAYF